MNYCWLFPLKALAFTFLGFRFLIKAFFSCFYLAPSFSTGLCITSLATSFFFFLFSFPFIFLHLLFHTEGALEIGVDVCVMDDDSCEGDGNGHYWDEGRGFVKRFML